MSVGRFRKKPGVVEAVQWLGSKDNFDEVVAFIGPIWKPGDMGGYSFWIETLEGDHLVRIGDWIIKGAKGEFYPCKPDIFAITYEEDKE